ncbi:DUF5753 domain-containing protein [Saccharothrix hoggarensis]|uniref:DUF5753 domain-containing protein n=1 Tax=Saccharothrix hoggarensis TaxID=913853 RepID=A0ABW3QGM9_9PSEU
MAEIAQAAGGDLGTLGQGHWSHVEGGTGRVEEHHLAFALSALNANEHTRSTLHELWSRAYDKGKWREYSDIVSEPVEMLGELCELAGSVRTYDTLFIPGLLQTPDYTRAVAERSRAFVVPNNVDRIADLRAEWQKQLVSPGFQGLRAVMTEGALRTQVRKPGDDAAGEPDVLMREQYQYLLDVGRDQDRPPVTIQVMPFTVTPPGLDTFMIFEFPDDDDPDMVFVDGDTSHRIYEEGSPTDKGQARRYRYTFDVALAEALTPAQSLSFIDRLLKETKTP